MDPNQNGTHQQINMASNSNPTAELPNKHLRKKNLTNEQRLAIANWLLIRFNDGRLAKNAISNGATEFGVSVRTISTIWNRSKISVFNGDGIIDAVSRKLGRSGRKAKNWDENWQICETFPSIEDPQ